MTSETKGVVGDVPVVTKELVGHVDNSSYPLVTVNIQLTLTTPAEATGPVPVIMQFTYDPKVMAALRARMAARNGPTAFSRPHLAGTGYGQRLGIRDLHPHHRTGRQRRGPDAKASSAW